MKKRRLSFFQGFGSEDKNSEESATVEPAESAEPSEEPTARKEASAPEASGEPAVAPEVTPAPAADEASANRMQGAFAAVAQAMDGEVESLRRSLGELEKTFNRDLEAEKEARTNAVNESKRELGFRIAEFVSDREKAVAEMKQSAEQERVRVDGCVDEIKQAADRERERVDGRVDEFKQAVDRERERVDGRVDEAKSAMEERVDKKVEELSGAIDAVARNLAAIQLELQRQMETSERVTGLLNNVAGVFSVGKAQPNPISGDVAAQLGATGSIDDVEDCDPKEVEDALERAFK